MGNILYYAICIICIWYYIMYSILLFLNPKHENLWNSDWFLFRTHHNYLGKVALVAWASGLGGSSKKKQLFLTWAQYYITHTILNNAYNITHTVLHFSCNINYAYSISAYTLSTQGNRVWRFSSSRISLWIRMIPRSKTLSKSSSNTMAKFMTSWSSTQPARMNTPYFLRQGQGQGWREGVWRLPLGCNSLEEVIARICPLRF